LPLVARSDAFDNPATGETYRFVSLGPESLRIEWRLRPGGRVPLHSHPRQTESFEIHSGEVRFEIDGEPVRGAAGDSIAIPPGAKHAFENASGAPAEAIVELTPPLNAARFFETFSALARAGKTTAAGAPRNPLQLAVSAHWFRDEFRAARPPFAVQRPALAAGARLGRLLGYRPEHS